MGVEFNHYAAIAAELQAAVGAAVRETATEIERDVKGRAETSTAGASPSGGPLAAPYVTGNLRRSYHIDAAGIADPVAPHVEVGSDPGIAPYAVFVEYGTSKMEAEPHLVPSMEAQRLPFIVRVKEALRLK